MKIENITKKENESKYNEYIRKAKEYLHLILYAVEKFERYGLRPKIVMSQDIFELLAAFTQNTMKNISYNKTTCCGREVTIAFGNNILYVALDLQHI